MQVALTCLHCGEVNMVIANKIPDGTEIDCSHCRAVMGLWDGATHQLKGANAATDLNGMDAAGKRKA